MALETLVGIKTIGGFDVHQKTAEGRSEIAISDFIFVDHEDNTVKFKIQNGPIKENGVNGCQVDTIIETARFIISGLNLKFPCPENVEALSKLDEALVSLKVRTTDREIREVEGTSQA